MMMPTATPAEILLVLAVGAACGMLLGAAHFGALWKTIQHLPASRHPIALMMLSSAARLLVVLCALYVLLRGSLPLLIGALVGLYLARSWLIQRWGDGRRS